MKYHAEQGMFYLGVLTRVDKDEACTHVKSNLTCGYSTVLHA